MPCHQAANCYDIGPPAREHSQYLAPEHHRNAVAEGEKIVKFFTHEDDRASCRALAKRAPWMWAPAEALPATPWPKKALR